MKVTKEKVENSQAYLSIEMEPAEVESSLQKAYLRLVKKANIPGFRKGKAPRPVLERYVGRESLLEEALNQLVPEAYEKAVKEQELEPIAQPRFEVTQTEPVVFKAVVPLRPTVKLGDYRAIRLTPPAVEFKEESVEAVMERLRHEQATWEPAECPAELGDLVVLDLEGRVDSETLMNRPGLQLVLRADSTYPAPGFATQVAGLKTGEEKEFQLTLPSEYPR
ncbi:MAG: trigger factor, partial [Chloroflexota bacterium]